MDVLAVDPTFPDVLGTDIEIDNDSLTFENFDLEKFINDDACLPEDPITAIAYNQPHPHSNGFRINNIHLRGLGSQTGSDTTNSQTVPPMYCNQQQRQQQNTVTSLPYTDNHQVLHTTLPDSPPDSEPYSPPDGHPNGHVNGHTNGHSNPHSVNNNPQNTRQDTSKFTLTSTPSTMHSQMYPTHHRPPGNSMGQQKTIVTMPGYHEPPLLNHLAPPTSHHQHQLPPVTMPLNVPPAPANLTSQILNPAGNLSPQSKKRKHMESPNALYNRNGLQIPNIKQEPNAYTNSSYMPDCDEDYSNYDPDGSNGYDNGVYQVIKWEDYQRNKWVALSDANLKDLPAPHYKVDADKGFNFSMSDNSFVCQKKNHFQITCHIGIAGDPKYIRTPEGVKKIDHYCLHFFGIKHESPSQTIKIEQSQSDRSKKPFKPVRVDLMPDQMSKMTVGRLHFSETTSNNMRKKGKPNPDQRFFNLVVALNAHSGDNSYIIAGSVSGKIIVRVSARASNPGQFDSDMESQHWMKGSLPESVYHIGCVGVNTDHPDEALTVHGNIKLSGQILHTSDIRAKQDLTEIDSKEQLKKVSGIKLYNYRYSDDYADHVGLPEDKRKDTGVIAQEIQELLPDAVIDTGDVQFENGGEIKNLLVVNKDRIFMENVGAVKELCKLTDNLEVRIDELEKMNTKLSKLKRLDSLKSTISTKSSCSSSTVASSVAPKKSSYQKPSSKSHHHHSHHRHKSTPPPAPAPAANGWCSNRFIQITIIVLICIMAFCLISITILYILEKQNNSNSGNTTVNNYHLPHGSGGGTSNGTASTSRPHTTRPASQQASTTAKTTIPSQEDHTTTPRSSIQGNGGPVIPAPCGSTSPPCPAEVCCDRSNDESKTDLTGYQTFLSDIQKMNGNKIQVIVHTGISDNDSNKDKGYNSGNPYRIYKRRVARELSGYGGLTRDFPALITITELNFTISEQHFDYSDSIDNNITYNIYYSKYLGTEDTYTLQFRVEEGATVHMCHNGPGETCGSINNVSSEDWPLVAEAWRIKLGKYRTSFFQFRVTNQLDLSTETVCTLTPEEAPGHYTEYNMIFARYCSE